MTLAQPIPNRATPQEYLRYEYDAKERHEFRDGVVTAMAGGSPPHSLIIANLIREVGNGLKGKPCRVYDSNLRVRSLRRSLYTYPDATIICGDPEFDPQDTRKQTVINPKLVIEVLSPSSEGDDRGEKFDRYRDIDSLHEYVLVSQTVPRIDTFYRQPEGGWLFNATAGLEAVAKFASVDIEVKLKEVFDGVEFPTPQKPDDSDA